jgi:putative transposase
MIWEEQALAWLVTDYLLMPDHLHLFCAPFDRKVAIEQWIAYWKYCVRQRIGWAGKFQRGGFHHRLRSAESYSEKWSYVRENPVRAGLVVNPEDWPFQGRVHEIQWSD